MKKGYFKNVINCDKPLTRRNSATLQLWTSHQFIKKSPVHYRAMIPSVANRTLTNLEATAADCVFHTYHCWTVLHSEAVLNCIMMHSSSTQ